MNTRKRPAMPLSYSQRSKELLVESQHRLSNIRKKMGDSQSPVAIFEHSKETTPAKSDLHGYVVLFI